MSEQVFDPTTERVLRAIKYSSEVSKACDGKVSAELVNEIIGVINASPANNATCVMALITVISAGIDTFARGGDSLTMSDTIAILVFNMINDGGVPKGETIQ